MSKESKFYVKKIKKDKITIKEEKDYKSPLIIFLITNGRLIFIITLLLSISTLIISTSLVFKNMNTSVFPDNPIDNNNNNDNNNITEQEGLVTVDISLGDKFILNNAIPITEEYATKLYDSVQIEDSSLLGVVIKIKEINLETKKPNCTITYYSDKTALIKYKNGTYLRVYSVNNNYGVDEEGNIDKNAKTKKVTPKEIVNKKLNIKLTYLSDGSMEVTKDNVTFFVRNSDITSNDEVFYTNLSIVSLPIKKDKNKTYYSNNTIKEDNHLLINGKIIKEKETKKIHDNITIIYYENGFAEIIQNNQSIIVEKKDHIIYDDNILEIVGNTKEEKENIDNLIGIKNIKIKNNNKKEINYIILLEETSNYNKYNITKRLPNKYIKQLVSINNTKENIKLLDNNIKEEPKYKGLKLTNNAYLIYEGKLDKSKEANIKIGMWVDYNSITNEYMNSAFIGTIRVYVE